jgi:hypothetical protein
MILPTGEEIITIEIANHSKKLRLAKRYSLNEAWAYKEGATEFHLEMLSSVMKGFIEYSNNNEVPTI